MARKRSKADTVAKNGGAGKRLTTTAQRRSPKIEPRGSKIEKSVSAASKAGRGSKTRNAPPRRAQLAKSAIRYEVGRLIDSEEALAEATEGLRAIDPEFVRSLVALSGPPPLRLRAPGFSGLAAIIVSQQVSVASATAIFGRLEARLAPLDAPAILAADDETLRACGLSGPKIRALRSVARAVAEGLDLAALGSMDAADAHRALVAVSGIGPWTADIFLLFCLGHPDAFPAGDLALQEAARLALGLETRPDARGLEAIAERWRPWRGVASRMLWAYYRHAKQRSGMALAGASR